MTSILSSTSRCSDLPAFQRRLGPVLARAACLSEAEFGELALELFRLQAERNEAYGRLCRARGARSEAITSWKQMPCVPTAAFKELEISCLRPEERTAVFYSSGTTGQAPSRHFHHAQSLALYEASLAPWFEENVLEGRGSGARWRWAILTPPLCQAPHSSLVRMFDTVWRRAGAPERAFLARTTAEGAWTLDVEAATAALGESVRTGQPLLALGTAFMFVHLLDSLDGHGRQFVLPPGSRAMETGGYKGRSRTLPASQLHALITRRLAIPPAAIIREYGMSELSSQAYDRPLRRIFRFPCWARAQVVSPETGLEVPEGETGLIRVFDLANIYSVLAIQTEDLAIRRRDGFEVLGRAALAEPRGCSWMAARA